jgi:hypothetical protein
VPWFSRANGCLVVAVGWRDVCVYVWITALLQFLRCLEYVAPVV